MATAIVVFHQAGNRSTERDSMPVMRLDGSRTVVLTTSGASVQTSINADGEQDKASDGGFATIYAGAANLWVTSSANPTAVKPTLDGAAGTGFPILANTSATFAIADNDEIALIEWT
jgi:hypothetical protein